MTGYRVISAIYSSSGSTITAKRLTSCTAHSRACSGSSPNISRSTRTSPASSMRTRHAASVSPFHSRASIWKRTASRGEPVCRALNPVPEKIGAEDNLDAQLRNLNLPDVSMPRRTAHIRCLLQPNNAFVDKSIQQGLGNQHSAAQGTHHIVVDIVGVSPLDMSMSSTGQTSTSFQASPPNRTNIHPTRHRSPVEDHSRSDSHLWHHHHSRKPISKGHQKWHRSFHSMPQPRLLRRSRCLPTSLSPP